MKNERNNCINSVNLNADSDFPYLVLDVVGDQSYPRNPGFQVMHWHEDLQFIYVLDGEIEIKTLDTSVQVNKGSGIFINKNVIHLVKKSLSCHYNSSIFLNFILEARQRLLWSVLSVRMNYRSAAFRKKRIGVNRFSLCFPVLLTLKTEKQNFTPMRCSVCSVHFGLKYAETFNYRAEIRIPLLALVCRNFYNISANTMAKRFLLINLQEAQMSANRNVCAALRQVCRPHRTNT